MGTILTVKIDRPLGSTHPKHPDLIYPVNYGYIPGLFAPDGEEQDVYLLGVDKPVKEFTGELIAVIHRLNDVEDKWVIAPLGMKFSREEIVRQVAFQERYFQSELAMEENEREEDFTDGKFRRRDDGSETC